MSPVSWQILLLAPTSEGVWAPAREDRPATRKKMAAGVMSGRNIVTGHLLGVSAHNDWKRADAARVQASTEWKTVARLNHVRHDCGCLMAPDGRHMGGGTLQRFTLVVMRLRMTPHEGGLGC